MNQEVSKINEKYLRLFWRGLQKDKKKLYWRIPQMVDFPMEKCAESPSKQLGSTIFNYQRVEGMFDRYVW